MFGFWLYSRWYFNRVLTHFVGPERLLCNRGYVIVPAQGAFVHGELMPLTPLSQTYQVVGCIFYTFICSLITFHIRYLKVKGTADGLF